MKTVLVYFILSGMLVCASCSRNMEETSLDYVIFEDSGANSEVASEDIAVPDHPIDTNDTERKIIKEGQIHFETSDPAKTKTFVLSKLNECKGYVAEENRRGYDGRTNYTMTLRIPATHFDFLLAAITQSARKVDNQSVKAIDVTEEFIDAEARLKTKKELESRYRELLQRTSNVNDILEIEKQIGVLRSDIESVEGRMRYLQSRIAYSTLTIEYYEPGVSNTPGFASQTGNAFKEGWSNTLSFFVLMVSIWPVLLIAAAVIFLFRRRKIKKRNKKQ